jgi:hypothetical protein
MKKLFLPLALIIIICQNVYSQTNLSYNQIISIGRLKDTEKDILIQQLGYRFYKTSS